MDLFCEQRKQCTKIDLMKIDVETHEAEVMEGALLE
ncbi:MAG: FkbM family methyltransferase [Bacteroidetes bacterium]|nr:FkbM family methyltransferase [Bacteroidota bacterium]